ncbi:unnamed protein product [Rotaria sordida]|uniref:Uncharacterized protein n=1 Tax=Rotaria sordida TaxID=392033 RepID=A0A816CKF9_9BILA|nr:unnamed protein product [Rotaria sordida]CAF1626121.1 unnamed protein product [Rotaria sordida]CAF4063010.1 unnamed protein product [Rotaria sordida]
MFSSTQNSSPTCKIIEIPPGLIENGKTLLIETHYELFINDYHFSRPSHFITQNHGLCLVDTQQNDFTSNTYCHELNSHNYDYSLFELIIEFPAESLNGGKSVMIERIYSNEEKKLSGNFEDLYNIEHLNESAETKFIHIKVPQELIEGGKTIVINKNNISIKNSIDYYKEVAYHLGNNKFSKRDHLQSKNMMEMIIALPPELFCNDHKIIFRKEDSQIIAANFPYHRQSKHDIQLTRRDNLNHDQKLSLDKFFSNRIWHPMLLNDTHLLKLSLYLNNQPNIRNQDQIKLIIDQQYIRVETKNNEDFNIYQEILVPDIIKLDQLKYEFDEKNRYFNIMIPLQ